MDLYHALVKMLLAYETERMTDEEKKHRAQDQHDFDAIVKAFTTRYPEGYTTGEQRTLVAQLSARFPHLTWEGYGEAMGINTAMMREGQTVNYHDDVEGALWRVCSGTSQHPLAWD